MSFEQTYIFSVFAFWVSTASTSTAQVSKVVPRGPQDCPRGVDESPGEPQYGQMNPQDSQECPKRAPRGSQDSPKRATGGSQEDPRRPQDGPRTAQGLEDCPKSPQTAQDSPKILPSISLQSPPTLPPLLSWSTCSSSCSSIWGPGGPQKSPKRAQGVRVRVLGLGCFGPGCSGAPVRVLRLGSSVPGLGCKDEGVGVRVLGFGCLASGESVGVLGCLGVALGLSGLGADVHCSG